MLNRFPVWKNVLIVAVIVVGLVYSLPNLFGEDPSVQVSPLRNAKLDAATADQIKQQLADEGITPIALERTNNRILARFQDTETQLKAADLLRSEMAGQYTVALNLAPATPGWLQAIHAAPMYLGLDLRGGVHFLLQVDMEAAIRQAESR